MGSQLVNAGLPPTTSKDSTDTSPVTTFHFEFPNFTGTHTSTTFALGVNSITGGGTGQTTASAAFAALLPSFTAGSVIFSDGTTLAEDNANFFWDNTNNRLDLGNPPFPSDDLTARLRNYWISTDPTNNLLVNNFNSINYTITDDSATNLLNTESQLVFAVAAGKSNFAFTANHYSLIGRGDGGDEGYVGFTANYLGSLTHGGSALKHTGLYAAFMHGFDSIGSDGLIDNMYDFYAQGGSPGAGAITNRYGIVIEPDSGYTKNNWLSGKLLVGGPSFSAPTTALGVIGDAAINQVLPDDTGGSAINSAVASHTTVDGSITTIASQNVASATVESGATNDKVVAGVVNTIQRGNGTDQGALSAIAGTQNLIFHNTDAAGSTSNVAGFQNLTFTIGGTITDLYDFRGIRIPAGSGVVTNHWGIYIDNDSDTPVKNFLSGQTKLGGSGFTATSDALYIEGDATMTGVMHSVDTNESLDLNARHLIKNGYNVVDYDNDKLTDDGGNDSLDWKNRVLSSTNNPMLDYSGTPINVKVHLQSTQTTAPTATVQASAGTGATCSVSNATDTAGQIQVVTGTLGLSTGAYCTLNFNVAYGTAPICLLTPASATLSTSVYVTSTVNDATVNFAVAGGLSSTYLINYHCIETQ